MNWSSKIAVVTGASAGMGAEIVLALAKTGVHVVGLARRVDRIKAAAAEFKGSGQIHAIECDISKPESIEAAFATIKSKFDKIHILINNAGRFFAGSTLSVDVPHQEYINTININLTGVLVCTREAFKLIKNHDELAYIINVNSVGGHASPNVAAALRSNIYSATKHALKNHTEMVRLELASTGNKRIRVTNLSPGLVKTEFLQTSGTKKEVMDLDKLGHLNGGDIADAVLYLLSLPQHVNITELTIRKTGETF